MSHEVEEKTTVAEDHSTTVPAPVRREAGIEAGDVLRWRVDGDGHVSVEVVNQRYGALSELDPVDVGTDTDVTRDHDRVTGDE